MQQMKPVIKIKRVYEQPAETDGYRVLTDRLWPRGIRKEDASLDEWAKGLAPSTQLRKWFGHDPALWDTFRERYRAELKNNRELTAFVTAHRHKKKITLLFGGKDTAHTHALVLQEYLEQQFSA